MRKAMWTAIAAVTSCLGGSVLAAESNQVHVVATYILTWPYVPNLNP